MVWLPLRDSPRRSGLHTHVTAHFRPLQLSGPNLFREHLAHHWSKEHRRQARFVAGIVLKLCASIQPLWAAISAASEALGTRRRGGRVPPKACFAREVVNPARWVRAWLRIAAKPVSCRRLRWQKCDEGIGAVFLKATSSVEYWADKLETSHEESLQANTTDFEFMAPLMLLAIPIAPSFKKVVVQVQEDSLASLCVARKLPCGQKVMSALATELSLDLEVLGFDTVLSEHVRGEDVQADGRGLCKVSRHSRTSAKSLGLVAALSFQWL